MCIWLFQVFLARDPGRFLSLCCAPINQLVLYYIIKGIKPPQSMPSIKGKTWKIPMVSMKGHLWVLPSEKPAVKSMDSWQLPEDFPQHFCMAHILPEGCSLLLTEHSRNTRAVQFLPSGASWWAVSAPKLSPSWPRAAQARTVVEALLCLFLLMSHILLQTPGDKYQSKDLLNKETINSDKYHPQRFLRSLLISSLFNFKILSKKEPHPYPTHLRREEVKEKHLQPSLGNMIS